MSIRRHEFVELRQIAAAIAFDDRAGDIGCGLAAIQKMAALTCGARAAHRA